MAVSMNILWSDMFPSLGGYTWNDFEDKQKIQAFYNRYFIDRLLSMFKYEGLPESVPQRYVEMYLLTHGTCGFIRDDQGDLRVIYGNYGGQPDVYFVPTLYYYANPYLDKHIGSDDKAFEIGKDVIVVRNDSTMSGILAMLNRYTALMTENCITARMEIINMRRIADIIAPDDKSRASAELYLKRVEEGKLGVMADNALLDGIKVNPVRSGTSGNTTSIIEMQQYLKASFYNELGLNANWNAKRESINSNESQLNDDMLTPLIDNMLTERKLGIEEVNKLFGTEISVDFNSAWKENEEEKELIMEAMEAAADPQPETVQETEDEAKDPENITEDKGND